MQIDSLKTRWPLFASLGLYWSVTFLLIAVSVQRNDGHFIYPLDDTYIHMAVAKNVALHNVWGVTEYGFTSSTSSPLWTGLLALVYFVFGVSDKTPLILNLSFGTALVFSVDQILKERIPNTLARFIVLGLVVLVTPLPTITFAAMEHTLHGLLTLWFVYLSSKAISAPQVEGKQSFVLPTLAFFLAVTRYEGLFVIFMVCLLLSLKKKWSFAFQVGAAGILSISIYGMWSLAHGWYFIPNSVLVKANTPTLNGGDLPLALQITLVNAAFALSLVALMLTSFVLLIWHVRRSEWNDRTYLHLILLVATFLQIMFARTGWLFRYEAYLILLGIVSVALTLGARFGRKGFLEFSRSSSLAQRTLLVFLFLVLISSFAQRVFQSMDKTPRASTNIYEQQYQMARFLKQYYSDEVIALNDIGLISYSTDVHIVDLIGLGNMEVTRAKTANTYDTKTIRQLAQKENVRIAIVVEKWYAHFGGLPPEWQKLGDWEEPDNIYGADKVSFLAVDPAEKSRLENNLRDFSPQLPQSVIQSGAYMSR